jgi:hypothetical protein
MSNDNMTPELIKEMIHEQCEKRYKSQTEKGFDPIAVEAKITYPNKKQKSVGVKLLPVIITKERFEEFVSAYGGEYMYDPNDNVHRRIFWFKPTNECKTIQDLFALNIEEIYSVFGRLNNVPGKRTTEGGIVLG